MEQKSIVAIESVWRLQKGGAQSNHAIVKDMQRTSNTSPPENFDDQENSQ
jgi:hypothetical protein